MKKKSEVISFRADEDELRVIDQLRKAFELSRGKWVKFVTFAYIQEKDNASVLEFRDDIIEALERLQTNQARILFALLTVVGKMKPDDAMEIVRTKLRS